VYGAGAIYIDGGRIVRVTNETGHYMTTARELAEVVAPAFDAFKEYYHPTRFQGFIDYRTAEKLPWDPESPSHGITPDPSRLAQFRADIRAAKKYQQQLKPPRPEQFGEWERELRRRFIRAAPPDERPFGYTED
jgi:hypothetical protein